MKLQGLQTVATFHFLFQMFSFMWFGTVFLFFIKRIHLYNNISLKLRGSLPCCTNKHQSPLHTAARQQYTCTVIGAPLAGYLPKHSLGRALACQMASGLWITANSLFKREYWVHLQIANLNKFTIEYLFTSCAASVYYSPHVYCPVHGAGCNPRHCRGHSYSSHVPVGWRRKKQMCMDDRLKQEETGRVQL